MSINFRSRVVGQNNPPSIIGQTTKGFCCGPDTADVTKTQCLSLNGYFLPGETTSTNCPTIAPCQDKLIADNPGACCYWEKVEDTYKQKCTTTNTKQECIQLNAGVAEGLPYSFYIGETCAWEGGNIACNGVKTTIEDISNNCNPNDNTNCYNPVNIYGNCCIKSTEKLDAVDCSITTEQDCKGGFWTPPGISGILSCVGLSPCAGLHYSKILNGNTVKVIESEITTSQNPLDKLPNPGEQYQGGIFVGIFRPGTPINPVGSTVYGSGVGYRESSDYIARGTGVGTKENAWILIASNEDYGEFSYNATGEQTVPVESSVYDGYYNTYSLEAPNKNVLMDALKNYSDSKGFNDWYIPSQDELAFFFKNIEYGYSSSKFQPLFRPEYMSSTTFTSNNRQIFLGDVSFIYTQQNNNVADYGKILLAEKHKKVGVRLFRRIYIGDTPSVSNATSASSVGWFLKYMIQKCPFRPNLNFSYDQCITSVVEAWECRLGMAKKLRDEMYDDARKQWETCIIFIASREYCTIQYELQQQRIRQLYSEIYDLLDKQLKIDARMCENVFPIQQQNGDGGIPMANL